MSKVYLIGAGPGDADLITLKGIKAIENEICKSKKFKNFCRKGEWLS